MWLLDANMDVHLVDLLSHFGVNSDTAANRGWKALSHGQLVAAAVTQGFACLLTRDRLFANQQRKPLAFTKVLGLSWFTCRNSAGLRIANIFCVPGGSPQ